MPHIATSTGPSFVSAEGVRRASGATGRKGSRALLVVDPAAAETVIVRESYDVAAGLARSYLFEDVTVRAARTAGRGRHHAAARSR